jgi:hypothetical protein
MYFDFALFLQTICLVALAFGAMLAGIEGWSVSDGFYVYYVCSNLLGLGNPLVNSTPITTAGMMMDVVIGTWSPHSAPLSLAS